MTTEIGYFNVIAGYTFEQNGFSLKRLDGVVKLAEKSHAGQKRKYNGESYLNHPLRVATTILDVEAANPNLENMVLAALLHDVLEDTATTAEEIEKVAGPEVLKLAVELTNPSKGLALDRKARKQIDREHLAAVSNDAKIIKLADRLDNISDLAKTKDSFKFLYARETEELVGAIDMAQPFLADCILSLTHDILDNY